MNNQQAETPIPPWEDETPLPKELEEEVNRQVIEEIGEADYFFGYSRNFWAAKKGSCVSSTGSTGRLRLSGIPGC